MKSLRGGISALRQTVTSLRKGNLLILKLFFILFYFFILIFVVLESLVVCEIWVLGCQERRVTKKLWGRFKQSWDRLPQALLTCLALMNLVRTRTTFTHKWWNLLFAISFYLFIFYFTNYFEIFLVFRFLRCVWCAGIHW